MTIVIYLFLIMSYVTHVLLYLLNDSNKFKPLTDNVADIYDQSRYQSWLNYSSTKTKATIIHKTIFLLVVLLTFVLGFFQWLDNFSSTISQIIELNQMLFIAICWLVLFFIQIVFSYYDTFYVEEKYGFNTTTIKTFISDKVKSFLLMIIIGGGLIFSLFTAFQAYDISFIAIAWVYLSFIFVLVFLFSTKFAVRLFYRLVPLPESSLKEKINTLANKSGFKVNRIYIMNASKRTKKLNAFFSGMGRTKCVVLFDTLIDAMNEDEICAVLAHELGHAKYKDTSFMLMRQILLLGVYLFLFYFLASSNLIATAFGIVEMRFAFGIILFFLLIEPVDLLLDIGLNAFSRRAEYRADRFAAKHTSKESMTSALIELSKKNLAHLNPHPLFVLFFYTHPPLASRIKAIQDSVIK